MKNKAGRKIVLPMLLLLIMLSAGCGNEKNAVPDCVILDCDMGVMNDDSLALSMLLQGEKQGSYELLGITLTGGNLFIDAAFESEGILQTGEWDNTKQFLESVGRRDIPVYRGSDYPIGFHEDSVSELAAYYEKADYLLYNDGYGAIHAYESTVSGTLCSSDAASDFMIQSVRNHPGSVIIIATGPTMNIARAIEKDPSFAENVKAVYYMGGAFGDCYEAETVKGETVYAVAGANVTAYAEYNVLYDPNAFLTCLTAGFPQQYITPAELCVEYEASVGERLKAAAGANAIASAWRKQYEESIPEYPYWDPLTVFAYLQPEHILKAEEKYITVNTDRKDARFGETTAISPDEYNALSGNERSMYGKLTLISEVESFWDETLKLLTGSQGK